MSNINVVAITGNLCRDPELRTTGGGTSVCTLRVAVNDRRKVDGEWADVAGYYDVVTWAGQAENCARFLSKGRPVAVQGRLDWREWQQDDGQKRQAVQIVADSVQFLGSRDDTPAADGSDGPHAHLPHDGDPISF